MRAEVIAVGIKSSDFSYKSHQMTLKNATDITSEIHKYACRLFDELWTARLSGISGSTRAASGTVWI